jgi:Tfp pilus assembly PilM family ATPase
MLSFLKKDNSAVGVDLGSGYLKMAQLSFEGKTPCLIEAACEKVPAEIKAGSAEWQRWSVKAIKSIMAKAKFKSKNFISAMPSDDVYIEHVKVGKNETDIEKAVFEIIKNKLPFDANNALVKCVSNDEFDRKSRRDVVAMVVDKVKVDRHLAIFEKAGLNLKSMSVWPLVITTTYKNFFARRSCDSDMVAMLLDIGFNHSNIIITKCDKLLFAKLIPIGLNGLVTEDASEKLVAELSGCVRYFESMETGLGISRLLFLSGKSVDKAVCEKIAELAKQMHIPAQIGDVLAAVEIKNGNQISIDRCESSLGWATAFGLSLS